MCACMCVYVVCMLCMHIKCIACYNYVTSVELFKNKIIVSAKALTKYGESTQKVLQSCTRFNFE